MCEYQAGFQSALKTHKHSKHEGFKHSCDECEYKTGYKSTLRKHKQSKHEGVKYSCDECEYQAEFQSGFKHTNIRNMKE